MSPDIVPEKFIIKRLDNSPLDALAERSRQQLDDMVTSCKKSWGSMLGHPLPDFVLPEGIDLFSDEGLARL